MNGAQSLVRSLIAQGIKVCFANPGTSEMHFVAALDSVPGLRCILGLHETVVTGAADGYGRMTGSPAVTLLHTGPGLANGLSGLHNARKAWAPIVNIVGEHALSHLEYDAPLTSDIQTLAAPMSHWVYTAGSANELAAAGAEAVKQANTHPGHIATLILPANTAWESAEDVSIEKSIVGTKPQSTAPTRSHDDTCVRSLSSVLAAASDNNEPVCIILGGHALHATALEWADRFAQRCGATLFAETFKNRFQRGEGRVRVTEIPYPIDLAIELLKPFKHVITVCAKAPVGFFGYPDKPSRLYPDEAQVHTLASVHDDAIAALQALCLAMGANTLLPRLEPRQQHDEHKNAPLSADAIGPILANQLPEDTIVVDEAITSGASISRCTQYAAAHDWLEVCGGSIGGGMPISIGAAVACPDRKVINLQADGSGMYCVQSLWTQARESLNITTIVFANSSYAILKIELDNVQASSGQTATDMMELDRPTIDWVALASGMGVKARKVTTVDEFREALAAALAFEGPFLIEAVI